MHQIRYFLALCETLNFTRAAERCHVTQPSLTRAIKALEDELGGPMFRRERRHTSMTGLGEMMRPHLAQVLAETEAARQRAKSFGAMEDAPLELGLMCTIGPRRLAGLIGGFKARHPRVDLRLHEARGGDIQRELLEGKIDVALYASPGGVDDRLVAQPLYRERFVVGFAPGHPFERLEAVRGRDLSGQRVIRRTQCEFHDYIKERLAPHVARLTVGGASDRDETVQSMALAGLGVCNMPEYSVSAPGLLTRPLVEPAIEREVSVVTVRGRRHLPAVAAFVADTLRHPWQAGA